jgi:lysine 2,3-aminomutase
MESSAPRRSVRTAEGLANASLVSRADVEELEKVAGKYAVAITPTILDRISTADPTGAVRRQFVPTVSELNILDAERDDPISDEAFSPVTGIVHRYPDRVLLKPLLVCPVYCRFCFRREAVGQGDGLLPESDLVRALEYIAETPQVWEVVLTGGDPLMMSSRRIGRILDALEAIEHVRTVRFHTRVPVVDPGRITDDLCAVLDRELPVWIVTHINAAEEVGPEASAALRRLSRTGLPLLGQSVLLRGINDTPEQLEALLRTLVRNRVKPYHLNHTDLANGTSHFRTPIEKGQEIMRSLRGSVSGLCQPTFILDIPGGHGKVPIGPQYLHRDGDGWQVTDPFGEVHRY